MPTISQSLREVFGPKLKTTESSEAASSDEPQPGTSGVANNTEANENVIENGAAAGNPAEATGSAQVDDAPASGNALPAKKRGKRNRTAKK